MKCFATIIFVLAVLFATAQGRGDSVGTIKPTRQTGVHDPVMIKEGSTYYLFCTGFGISVFSSTDLQNWKKEKPVFATAPQWAVDAVPGYRGHTWAPDISYYNGKYYLYYSVSTFGKNGSCIGVAVNKTLNPSSPDFKWEDLGKVIQSFPGKDQWNAIDPNLIVDEKNVPWLSFGSFWSGLKLVKLNSDLKTLAQPEQVVSIAARTKGSGTDSSGGNAIEAPFIFKKGEYYYLFASWDYCCRGEKSNYKVVVGRSKQVTGPYLDKNSVTMTSNGGTLVLEGDAKEWFGAGHNAVYHVDDKDYIVYHGYDALDKGRSKLLINELAWDKEGWPTLKK
ncbi:arabinan endo-1,5-alpha-L-arabinosidase [Lacibacter sediminis]|uniref:Arabinan endo-1,5-alpha-L-arabinosidase n=1 Tax=Lacibacter sediminis TaxID=2760713 RepID=A0A7G5XB39_9BACT|nr:arabinan endo-1,5-alpha-L-arabinosidase [Lacibacter sediminis]QNA42692.1 arabinan endo-1,5-alpha-L-arabinosidase [Lacibacter sediminis]